MNENAPKIAVPVRPPLIRPDSCGRCKFSAAIPGQTTLQCRRYPPTATHIQTSTPGRFQTTAGFPPVQPDYWCGEHVLKLDGIN